MKCPFCDGETDNTRCDCGAIKAKTDRNVWYKYGTKSRHAVSPRGFGWPFGWRVKINNESEFVSAISIDDKVFKAESMILEGQNWKTRPSLKDLRWFIVENDAENIISIHNFN